MKKNLWRLVLMIIFFLAPFSLVSENWPARPPAAPLAGPAPAGERWLTVKPNRAEAISVRTKRRARRAWRGFLGNLPENRGVPLPGPPPTLPVLFPFGGTVLAIFPCPCTGGVAMIILPFHGAAGPYMVPFFSLKKEFLPLPGNQVLGAAIPGGVCGTPFACFPFPTLFTVVPQPGMGTSLVPGQPL